MKPNYLIAKLTTLLALYGMTANAGTVQNYNDSGPGSLRAVIAAAAPGETITFGLLTGTIFLTSGELQISQNLNINGSGAKNLTIGANSSRIFNVAPAANASISGLTLQGNTQGNPGMGGGVFNAGHLSLNQCHITGCSAVGQSASAGLGGGIYSSGSLAMTACTVSYCRAAGGDGPAGSAGSGVGGGLYVLGSTTLTNCTLAWNKAVGGLPDGAAGGGAIHCATATGPLAMVNCTVSGNQAGEFGNYSDFNYGGGIITDFIGSLWMINCIALGNYSVCCAEEIRSRESVIYGVISTNSSHNLLYSGDANLTGIDGQGNLFEGSVDAVRLGWPLQDHGGPTPTLSIGKAGVAYDGGNDVVTGASYNLTTDQRGFARLAGSHVDVGAYELQFGFPCPNCSIYWNSPGSGRWDFQSNWGGGSPGSGYGAFITNATSKTITIDSFTSSNAMSISNLWVSAPTNSVNTLLLNAGLATPFRIHDNFFVLGGGALMVSNSAVQMNSGTPSTNAFANGSSVIFDGPAIFNSSSLDTVNAFDLTIGNATPGSLAMTNSTLNAYDLFVGSGASGTANFNNTTVVLNRSLFIATAAGISGSVNIVGGSFVATDCCNGIPSLVFERGNGQMTISSNATVQFDSALLGSFHGSASLTLQSGSLSFAGPLQLENGTLNLQGGTMSVATNFTLAAGSNSMAEANFSGGTLIVTNGSILVGSGGNGSMTVSNATVIARQIKLGGTTSSAHGLFRQLVGSIVKVLGIGNAADDGLSTNDLEVDGGDLDVSGAAITVGDGHDALFTVTGGTVEAGALNVGYTSGFTGTFNQSGGAVTVGANGFTVAYFPGSVGLVSITGGNLTNISSITSIGHSGVGQMTAASGTLQLGSITVGDNASSQGTLNVTGATINTPVGASLAIGANSQTATGAVSVVSGFFSPGAIVVGNLGNGQLTVSGGVLLVQNYFNAGIAVGKLANSRGNYTQSVGVVSTPAFTVGRATCDSSATATLNSGTLLVTNATHDAALTVQGGTFTMNGGTLRVDKLILTNSCGHFVKNGGTLIYASLVLDPNQDADGDGLSNGYEQAHGLDPLSPTTIFIVTNNNDSGAGSLRQATYDADGSSGALITFATNVTGTIALTSGELVVVQTMAIAGPGANVLTVSGNGTSRVFSVTNGIVNISELTLANGLGGIYMHDAALSVRNCIISGHNGSGIYNGTNGTLVLNNCTISSNRFIGPNFANIQGGGILNASSNAVLWMTNCTISANALIAHTTASIVQTATACSYTGSSMSYQCISGNGAISHPKYGIARGV